MFISFEDFYNIEDYNKFITAADNNKVLFTEWISIRPPFKWWLQIDERDIPKFLDFDISKPQEEQYFVQKIQPKKNQDKFLLQRRPSDSSTSYSKYIMNDVFTEVKEKNTIIFFRWKNKEQLLDISKNIELKDTKIYLLENVRNWRIAICTNKFIESFIMKDMILYTDYGSQMLKVDGQIEAHLNYKVIRTEKIKNKNFNTDYIMNGMYFPAIQNADF